MPTQSSPFPHGQTPSRGTQPQRPQGHDLASNIGSMLRAPTHSLSSPSPFSGTTGGYSRSRRARSWYARSISSRSSSTYSRSSSSRTRPFSRYRGFSRARSRFRPASRTDRRSWLDSPERGESVEAPSPISISLRSQANSTTTAVDTAPTECIHQDEEDPVDRVIMAVILKPKGTVGCAYYSPLEQRLYVMRDVTFGDVDYVQLLTESVNPRAILLPAQSSDSLMSRLDPFRSSASSNLDGSESRPSTPYSVLVRPSQEFSSQKGKEAILNLKLDRQGCVSGAGNNIRDLNPGFYSDVSFSVPRNLPRWTAVGSDDRSEADFTQDSRFNRIEEVDDEDLQSKTMCLRLASIFEAENITSIACANVVLNYLSGHRNSAMLPGDPEADSFMGVREIQLFSLQDTMFINTDTIQSLQIMNTETNPHFHNQGPAKATSREKEGLSVYGLFHQFARTSQGKSLLKQFFLRPVCNLQTINERLDSVSIFTAAPNLNTTKELSTRLRNIQNIRSVLINLQKGASPTGVAITGLKRSVWNSLRDFCFNMLDIIDLLNTIEFSFDVPQIAIITLIQNSFSKLEIASIGDQIERLIDFDTSREAQHTTVKSGVDERLDQLRMIYNGLDPLLIEMRLTWIARLPPDFLYDQLEIVYLPRIGFRMRVSFGPGVEPEEQIYGIDPNGPWVLQFKADPYAFYVNGDTAELDDKLGDVSVKMSDREVEIIHGLGQEVLKHEAMLAVASDTCGELDVRIALARGAIAYDLTRPNMMEDENVIDIKGGRHILQELVVPTFVSNPTKVYGGEGGHSFEAQTGSESDRNLSTISHTSDDEFFSDLMEDEVQREPSLLVMTGPNLSGKSVYLKQIGIIVYLAHIGSFVPAKSATIGLTTHILTRISTRESVSKVQSAFLIDLQQVSLMLKHASRRSLLLIDEFGKGTDSMDGAGLFGGLIKHLLKRGKDCPRTVISTHFHEIFENRFFLDLSLDEKMRLKFGYMEVQMSGRRQNGRGERARGWSDEEIGYLYNFRFGRSSMSLGIQCARLHGMPSEVTDRALVLNRIILNGEDLVSACAEPEDPDLAAEEGRNLKEAETRARRFLAVKWDNVEEWDVLSRLEEVVLG